MKNLLYSLFLDWYNCLFEHSGLGKTDSCFKLLFDWVSIEILEDSSFCYINVIYFFVVLFKLYKFGSASCNKRYEGSFVEEAASDFIEIFYVLVDDWG